MAHKKSDAADITGHVDKSYRKWGYLALAVFVFFSVILFSSYFRDNSKVEAPQIENTQLPEFPDSEQATGETTLKIPELYPDKQPNIVEIIPDVGFDEQTGRFDFVSVLHSSLHSAERPEKRQEVLDLTLAWLHSLPPDEAVALIQDLLDSGIDFEINMPFRVGQGGVLRSHPWLRVAALDWLGQLSPEAAMDYARIIFEQSGSADEWAVALRNYGRLIDPGTDEYFSKQVQRHISNEKWQAAPTGGFAEGFDALVYNQQYELIPDLIDLSQTTSIHHLLASTVLDNLVQHDREATIPIIAQHSDLFGEQSPQRALLMARADPRSPELRRIIEDYFLDSKITIEEKKVFADLFPHFSGFHAHRLLSTDYIYPLKVQAEIDFLTLNMIGLWKNNKTFFEYYDLLSTIKERLSFFVNAAYEGSLIKSY
ncbi:hypothetical protein [Desulfonatronovibrio magnus]|uniref:hypothetical protein n=1 Tax=Desulfonatronovibrio magnus TaxID=698827 RepID=UPI0005EB65DB|nr:hypothetical protein [Desulfonatronovibrio magnus]